MDKDLGKESLLSYDRVENWFKQYVRRFDSEDPAVQENIDLKAEHTRKVCEAIRDIGKSLDLCEEDLCLAEICALLHDIGRFEQYSRYKTFADSRSENHALLGVRIIQDSGILDVLDVSAAGLIVRAVECHNRARLPEEEPERTLFFIKLLRDADKVDIWRVVTEYYRSSGNNRNRTIELDLPDDDFVSDPVYESLMNGQIVQMTDIRTLQDFKLLQIGWIYDLNFQRTFQIVRERKYIEAIRDALPRNSCRIKESYERARAHLERNCSIC
ncbi:MAG: HD domain-containing protein [Acidobacteria bacterium]|nr:HD domain-containing protein [Acidobacteriota bacterium]